ncbi:transposase [Lacticaseibacillus suibinensis]|uniref:transposase n=1 Tax=Lacticaseibacillus suibinensis TaxID=2486011 RepID=UPI001941D522|nr:transposase [Lacticaseibacillus suibinensis]
MKENVAVTPKRILFETAEEYGFSFDRMEIGKDDHIHFRLSVPPKLSVTSIVRWLKEISNRPLSVLDLAQEKLLVRGGMSCTTA